MRKTEILNDSFQLKSRRYLGSKTKLLHFIHESLEKENIKFNSFFDIFGGTGVVGESFNNKCIIYENDILECNRVCLNAFLGEQKIDENKLEKYILSFNKVNPNKENYFSKNFSGTYFSKKNCIKIGFIREKIKELYIDKKINDREKDYLITSLIYSMDRIANTVGHYDAFRKGADLKKQIVLKKLSIPSSKENTGNKIYKKDANKLAREIECDLVYIDPPYNSRQYCDAYHLLENVACWKKPKLYGVAKKMDRSNIKSKYCEKSAPRVFDDLVSNLNCKYIVVSYNNMGLKGAERSQAKISDAEIISTLEKKGEVKIYDTDFNQFTVGKTNIDNHKERLFICKVGQKQSGVLSTENLKYAKSPINYTGGKFKILDDLISKFPEGDYTFVDLFGGGFNVGPNTKYNSIVYNEKDKHVYRLIKLLANIKAKTFVDKLDFLIKKYKLSDSELNGYSFYNCNSNNGLGKYNKIGFSSLKNDYNQIKDGKEKDIMLFLLTAYSFNNQIRFNSDGKYNMPVGKRDFNSSTRKNLYLFCDKLSKKKIIFSNKDFSNVDFSKIKNPFVYCDPPYLITRATYNENDGWNEKEEIRLLKFLSELNDKGIKFALSNVIEHSDKKNDLLLDWTLKNHLNLYYINKSYNNCNYQKKKKGKTVEVLITNY